MEKYNIIFNLIYDGKEYSVYTYRNQYFSLMSLISEQSAIFGFGLYSGMGSCGTCVVYIGEENSIRRTRMLSCNVRVDEELANMIVEVSDAGF